MADPRADLIGREFAGIRVTGLPEWSEVYVEVELADGTPSVRRADQVRLALQNTTTRRPE